MLRDCIDFLLADRYTLVNFGLPKSKPVCQQIGLILTGAEKIKTY